MDATTTHGTRTHRGYTLARQSTSQTTAVKPVVNVYDPDGNPALGSYPNYAAARAAVDLLLDTTDADRAHAAKIVEATRRTSRN